MNLMQAQGTIRPCRGIAFRAIPIRNVGQPHGQAIIADERRECVNDFCASGMPEGDCDL